MKFKKRILTSILAISLTASVGIPVSGLAMAQDTVNDDNSKTENEIVFTADGGNEVISINKPEEGEKEEEKPGEQEDPEKPYHEDDYGYDLELDSKFVTLERDYAQKLTVKVKNNTKKPMNYYLKAENPNDDIYLNFVQEGSEDAPLTIEPGAEKEIELSIFLQNASQKEYSIPVVAMASNGDSGSEFEQVSRHTVDFICNHGNVSYSLVAGALDEETLTQTYYVRNNGDDVSDLTISVGEDVSRYLSVSPLIENYYLPEGEELSFTVKPDFFNMDEDDMATVTGPIIATGGAARQELAATFKLPENYNTIEAWRLALYQDDNPYYMIEEEPLVYNNIYENIESLNLDSATEEEISEAIRVDTETGSLQPFETNLKYSYVDESGEKQDLLLKTSISSSDIDEAMDEPEINYNIVGDSVLVTTSFSMGEEEYQEFFDSYMVDARETFSDNDNVANMIESIREQVSEKSISNINKKIEYTVQLSDTGHNISEIEKIEKVARVLVTLRKVDVNNSKYDLSNYFTNSRNPSVDTKKKEKTTMSLISLATIGLMSPAVKAGITINTTGKILNAAGNFAVFAGNALTSLFKRVYNFIIPSNEQQIIDNAYYEYEQVKGEQCTNAGMVSNNVRLNNAVGGAITYPNSQELNCTELTENLFHDPSTKYNHDLALLSAHLSNYAYDLAKYGKRNSLMENNDYNFDYGEFFDSGSKDGAWFGFGSFYIAHKTFDQGGRTVLVICAKGTQSKEEDLKDYNTGDYKELFGTKVNLYISEFEENIQKGVKQYIKKYPEIKRSKDLKVLITGHSLGGAAANLVGARFTYNVTNVNYDKATEDYWWVDKVTKDDIYVYTYAAIDVLWNNEENIYDGYENIHNIYNYYDSFGPHGGYNYLGVSNSLGKFGHPEIISFKYNDEGVFYTKKNLATEAADYMEEKKMLLVLPKLIKILNTGILGFDNHKIENYIKELKSPYSQKAIESNRFHRSTSSNTNRKRVQANKKSIVMRVAKSGDDDAAEVEKSELQLKSDTSKIIYTTGRIFGVEEDYTDTEVTSQNFYVNGEYLGDYDIDGLTELYSARLVAPSFNMNDNNIVERVFNTNPGSHTIATDTEYYIPIDDRARIAYIGSLDSLDDIRALPDFAIYPENISAEKDAYLGDSNSVNVKVYNRGSCGGWTDVDIKVDGQIVHHEENLFIDPFSYEEISFDYTPTKDNHTVEVTLTNKTVRLDERTIENNNASKTLKFKRYEVPEISEITPTTLTLADTDEGAFVKCQINKDSTVQKVVFKVDDEVVAENEYVSGTGESSAFVPADKLTKGTHKVTAEVTYKENKTLEAVITKTENLEVKVRDTIDFEVKTNNYPYFRLLRLGNEYEEEEYEYEYDEDEDEDEYYGGGNSGEKRYYYEDSYELNRTKDEDNGVYKCSLYPSYDDMDLNNGDYYLLCEYDNGLEMIPVSELKGKTLSMEGAKKITVERTEDFSNVYINRTGKVNGVNLEYNYYLDDYNDYLMVGDGIDSIELSTSFYVSGGYDSQKDELDMTKGDGVIVLKDNTKTITLSNCSGDIHDRRLLAYSNEDYNEMDFNSNHSDNNYSMVFSAERNKQLQQSDKAILYLRDDEAIYEIDLKTLTDDNADLAELRDGYNSINYVYDAEKTQIISRTIKRKMPENVWANVSYSIDKDSIKIATGEYTVTTKYRSNGTVLEDVQEITVSGTDVDIVLSEAEEDMTTISVVYPDYYTSVSIEYYDDNYGYHYESVESGDKIVTEPGRRDYRIYAHTYDDLNVTLKRTVDVKEKTNTEIEVGDQFAASVHVSSIESDTNVFATTPGSSVSFDLTDFKDEYGSDLYNYSDYNYYDGGTKATLRLTDVNDNKKQYEVEYPYGVSYISYGEKVLSFTLPEEIEGDYNYEILMTRTVPDPPIPLEKIELDKKELTMEPGSEETLNVIYTPEDTTYSKDVYWYSSDDSIVTVEDGKLKALEEGEATVMVESQSTWDTDTCKVIVKHTHDMQTVLAKDPTCTEDGNIEYYICSKCEKWYEDKDGNKEITDKTVVVKPAIGHEYEESITKEASCEEAGVKTYTCKNDPTHTYTEEIAAIGHDWGDWQIIKEATETETGERERICKNDPAHIEKEEIPKLEHIHNILAVEGVEATCVTDGVKAHFECSGCEMLFEDAEGTVQIDNPDAVVIPATGHDWNEWIVAEAATCTQIGIERRVCKNDANHVEEKEIPAKGHSLIKTESKDPTCEEPGNIEYYTCSECGEIFRDAAGTQKITIAETEIKALGHDWGDWSVTTPATCTASGTETRTCSHGGEVETRSIPPLEHKWGEWQISKEATETEDGEKIRICENDPSHIDKEIIPATGEKKEEEKQEEQKQEEQKQEEQKQEEQKQEEQKQEEQKPEEQKPEEEKPEEEKPEEQKPEEQKPEEQKPEEQKPEEEKPEEEKPEEQKPEEQKRVDIDNKDNDSEKEITNSKVKTITNADEPVMSDDTSVEKYSREDNKVIEYKAEAVHTGDKNNLGWIIALSLSAVGIMAALIVFLNNRKKHKG